MPKMAKHVALSKSPGRFSLTIDGEEFPWYVAADPIATVVSDGAPTITLSIVADSLSVEQTLDVESNDE